MPGWSLPYWRGTSRPFAPLWKTARIPTHCVRGDLKHLYHHEIPVIALAAWTGEVAVVAALLEAGANASARCVDYRTYPFSDDETAFEGRSALDVAAAGGDEPVVQRLLDAGADPGESAPLCYAAGAGSLPIARRLLSAGGSLLQRDGDLHSAMHHAAMAGHRHVLEWLFAEGARFHRRLDLVGARERATDPDVRAWLTAMPDRDLLRTQISWWRTDLAPTRMEQAYGALCSAFLDQPVAWGAVRGEDEREEQPYGADWRDVIHTVERSLGPVVGARTRVRRVGPDGELQSERLAYTAEGLPRLCSEWRPAAGHEPLVLVGASGDGDTLRGFDATLGAASLPFALEPLGDTDSEYAARELARESRSADDLVGGG